MSAAKIFVPRGSEKEFNLWVAEREMVILTALSRIPDPAMREEYAKKFEEALGLDRFVFHKDERT